MKKMAISLVVSLLFLIGLLSACATVGAKESVKNVSLLPNARQETPKKNPQMQVMIGVLDDNHATLPAIPPAEEENKVKTPKAVVAKLSDNHTALPAPENVKAEVKESSDDSEDSVPKTLVERVAELEDKVNFLHPETQVPSVGNFAIGESELPPHLKRFLRNLAKRVKNGEIEIIKIIGNTDITKPRNINITNKAISLNRAERAKVFLKEQGVDTSKIKVAGAGTTLRYGENSENRRIKFILKKLK